MTPHSQSFDYWIRNRFVELNTELESLYSNQPERTNVASIGEDLKLHNHYKIVNDISLIS